MTTASTLAVDRLTKTYRRGSRRINAVKDISLVVEPGMRLGVVGESGSGKSTLARLLCGLSRPTAGSVLYGDEPVHALLRGKQSRLGYRRAVQFVAQDFGSSFAPGATCRRSVLAPAIALRGRGRAEEFDERLNSLCDAFQLSRKLLDRQPAELSGGQRQRLSLIRGILVDPEYLICDEVISALDVSVQAGVLNTLRVIAADTGMGLIFIAHNLPATVFLCEKVAVMYRGDLVELTDAPSLVNNPSHPYTRQLVDAYNAMEAAE